MAKYIESLMLNWEQYYIDTEWVSPITTPWIYHNSDLWLISLSSDWTNWVTIADKNLWATQVRNDGDTLSEANCGKYYQWWNNYGFPYTWSVTTSSTRVNADTYWPWNYYSSSTFITRSSYPVRRDSWDNANLWWWVTWTVEAMQWPCPSWYHIPSSTEFNNLYSLWVTIGAWSSSWWTNMNTYLKLPFAWWREVSNAATSWQWQRWNYFSASRANVNFAFWLDFYANYIWLDGWIIRGNASSIRPFANTPTQPDSTRTKLY